MGTLKQDIVGYKVLFLVRAMKACVKKRFDDLGLSDKGFWIKDDDRSITVFAQDDNGLSYYVFSGSASNVFYWTIDIFKGCISEKDEFSRYSRHYEKYYEMTFCDEEDLPGVLLVSGKIGVNLNEYCCTTDEGFKKALEDIKRESSTWEP